MELFRLITSSTTLLTPNRRLAATLLNQFNQFQMTQGKKTWETIDILPLQSWLQRLWNRFAAEEISNLPLLLNPNQKSVLWETILRQSPLNDLLLQIKETAEVAESAYELLKLWEINLNDPALSLTEDGKILQEWSKQFEKTCRKNNWIDNTSLVQLIKDNIISKIKLPDQIVLVGFTEIAPSHLNLFHLCEEHGTKIIHYNANKPAKSIKKINLQNEETEIRTMARWAKSTFEMTQEKKPYLIGCVVPRLETLRDSVLKIFSETFSEETLPFNISAGKSLLSFPVVHTAIELLKLTQENISLETFSYLLKSPFLGAAEKERIKRSHIENRLKNANVTSISLKKLALTDAPLLAKRIQRFLDYFLEKLKRKAIHEHLGKTLSCLVKIIRLAR